MRDSAFKNQERINSFLKTYEETHKVGGKSYVDYIRTRGKNARDIYTDAQTDAHRTHDRTLSTYGEHAESLGRAGGVAGYADYLNSEAASILATKKAAARHTSMEAQQENLNGYADYVRSETGKMRTIINQMRTQGIVGYNDAYAYALATGMEDSFARLAADLIDGMEAKPLSNAEQSARNNLIREMVELSLPRDAAYQYAMSCGIDSKSAADLADQVTEVLTKREQNRY